MLTSLPHRLVSKNPGRSAVGCFGWVFSVWVVSALFFGKSIRPILVGRFGRESFRPWVVLASLNIGAKSTYFCS